MSNKDELIELMSDDDDGKPGIWTGPSFPTVRAVVQPKQKKHNPVMGKKLSLQSGIVLQEDVEALVKMKRRDMGGHDDNKPHMPLECYLEIQNQRRREGKPVELYHDSEFECIPASIDGSKHHGKSLKCFCRLPAALSFIMKGPNRNKPYNHCSKNPKKERCSFFRWAFQSELMRW
jgi:hypothetical protein